MNRINNKRNKHFTKGLSLGIIILGIGIIFLASYKLNEQTNYAAIPTFTTEEIDDEVIETLLPEVTNDASPTDNVVATEEPIEDLYPIQPTQGETIGSLSIPALNQTFPIIEGTDKESLKKGVGHFINSILPGENNNCVISGHRDTVFYKLGDLTVGDQFIVQTSAGTFTYEIVTIKIVDKDDKTIIVPTDHAVLTVTTCYPFYFIGNAPDRYILIADLVTNN